MFVGGGHSFPTPPRISHDDLCTLPDFLARVDPVVGVEVQKPHSCSPRPMYPLATAVGIPYWCTAPSAETLKSLG